MIEPEISTIKPQPADKKKIFKIWWVAGILAWTNSKFSYIDSIEKMIFHFLK